MLWSSGNQSVRRISTAYRVGRTSAFPHLLWSIEGSFKLHYLLAPGRGINFILVCINQRDLLLSIIYWYLINIYSHFPHLMVSGGGIFRISFHIRHRRRVILMPYTSAWFTDFHHPTVCVFCLHIPICADRTQLLLVHRRLKTHKKLWSLKSWNSCHGPHVMDLLPDT